MRDLLLSFLAVFVLGMTATLPIIAALILLFPTAEPRAAVGLACMVIQVAIGWLLLLAFGKAAIAKKEAPDA